MSEYKDEIPSMQTLMPYLKKYGPRSVEDVDWMDKFAAALRDDGYAESVITMLLEVGKKADAATLEHEEQRFHEAQEFKAKAKQFLEKYDLSNAPEEIRNYRPDFRKIITDNPLKDKPKDDADEHNTD